MYLYDDHSTFHIEPAESFALHRMLSTRGFHEPHDFRPSCADWNKPKTAAGRAKLAANRAKARAARKQNAKRRRKG